MTQFMKHLIINMKQENNILTEITATHNVVNIKTNQICFIGTYDECNDYKYSSVYPMIYEIIPR